MIKRGLSACLAAVVFTAVLACTDDVPHQGNEVAQANNESFENAETVDQPAEPRDQQPAHTGLQSRYDAVADSLASLPTDSLIELLRSVEGELQWQGVVVGDFIGDKSVLFALIQRKDSVLVPLAECLDRTDPVATTWRGQELLLGHMCLVVLNSIVYYEHTDELGDLSGNWDGYVGVHSSIEEMRAAKAAWKKVIEEGRYNTL
jgi:hypothetical protein